MEKIYFKDLAKVKSIAACIGFFDGMHLGHQALVKKTIEEAKLRNIKSALITFDPDPNEVLKKEKGHHLSSLNIRERLVAMMGIDYFIILPFSLEIASYSPTKFINEFLLPLDIKALICGFDFRFGQAGKGNSDTLKEIMTCDIYVINDVMKDGYKISTTLIKEKLIEGKIEEANELLGYKYFIVGKVIKGKGNGHLLSFPTANVALDEDLPLKEGVYMGITEVNNISYPSMINYGHNPTFNGNKYSFEVHLVNYDGSLYGKEIKVYLDTYLRNEIKFNSIEELKEQLIKDEDCVKRKYRII